MAGVASDQPVEVVRGYAEFFGIIGNLRRLAVPVEQALEESVHNRVAGV